MRYPNLSLLLLLSTITMLGWTTAGWAETVEELQALAKSGATEETLLAKVEQSTAGFDLSTEQIIALKKAGVSENVITAMLKKQGSPAPAQAAAPAPAVEPHPEGQEAKLPSGVLNLENVDEKAWAYRLEAKTRTLWVSPLSEASQMILDPHAGATLTLPAGGYSIRYPEERGGLTFVVPENGKALVMISRVETAEQEVLNVTAFQDGVRKGSGRLATLRQSKGSGLPAASHRYVKPQSHSEEADGTPAQERVVVPPPKTVIYRSPAVIYPYPAYLHPYPGYAYPYPGCAYPYRGYTQPYGHLGIGYSQYRHGKGFSVGLGLGF